MNKSLPNTLIIPLTIGPKTCGQEMKNMTLKNILQLTAIRKAILFYCNCNHMINRIKSKINGET